MNYHIAFMLTLFVIITHIIIKPKHWLIKYEEDVYGINVLLISCSIIILSLIFYLF